MVTRQACLFRNFSKVKRQLVAFVDEPARPTKPLVKIRAVRFRLCDGLSGHCYVQAKLVSWHSDLVSEILLRVCQKRKRTFAGSTHDSVLIWVLGAASAHSASLRWAFRGQDSRRRRRERRVIGESKIKQRHYPSPNSIWQRKQFRRQCSVFAIKRSKASLSSLR